jgi:glycosyltransferase involved in cell wall biosynthesis
VQKVFLRNPILTEKDIVLSIITTPISGQCFTYPFFCKELTNSDYFPVWDDSEAVAYFRAGKLETSPHQKQRAISTPLRIFVCPAPKQFLLERYWVQALGVRAYWYNHELQISRKYTCTSPMKSFAEFSIEPQNQLYFSSYLKSVVWPFYSPGPIRNGKAQEIDLGNWLERQYFVGVQEVPRYTFDLMAYVTGLGQESIIPAYHSYIEFQKEFQKDISNLRKHGYINLQDDEKIEASIQEDRELYLSLKQLVNNRYRKLIEGYRQPQQAGGRIHATQPKQVYPSCFKQIKTFIHVRSIRTIQSVKQVLRKVYEFFFPVWATRTRIVERIFNGIVIKGIIATLLRIVVLVLRKAVFSQKILETHKFKVLEGKWFPESTTRGQFYRRVKEKIYPQDEAAEYRKWFFKAKMKPEQFSAQAYMASAFRHQPLISFVTPVYNPDVSHIEKMIQCVRKQTYPNWELCIADASSDAAVSDTISHFAQIDERIHVDHLAQNRGISGNSNICLTMANGEFIAILDHDDEIEPDYLFEIVRLLNDTPETDVIYFDEDKLDLQGRKCHPWFKPHAFDPVMLVGVNYLMHSVFRKSLVEKVGGFISVYDGAQDWDLALRISEQTDQIHHIARVLYHWRMTQQSSAFSTEAKSYVQEAQKTCVEAHLLRTGINAPTVNITSKGYPHVTWKNDPCLVSIVIPTKDKVEMLKKCIDGILTHTPDQELEIILVDTGSRQRKTRRFYEVVQKDSRFQVIDFGEEKFNYSRSINAGASHATGDMLLLLNNDTQPANDTWMKELLLWFAFPNVGVVGGKLLYPNHHIQHAGIVLGMSGHANHLFYNLHDDQITLMGSTDWYRSYLAVTGACQMVRKSVFEEVGGYDESYELVLGDVAFCLSVLNLGYTNMVNPFARLYHYESVSRGKGKLMPKGDIKNGYFEFSSYITHGDPYFNPQLSYLHPIPTLRNNKEKTRLESMQDVLDQYFIKWTIGE